MITGAEPVDESIFVPDTAPGVYKAPFPAFVVLGAVEMDGDQFRYKRAQHTDEFLAKKMSELEVVVKHPSSFFYDEVAKVVYLHTSDGRPPSTHEIELFKRGNGISVVDHHYVTIVGFTFRHMGDSGISFFKGAGDCAAFHNTSYGSRQGIRVYTANNILVSGNTLFRNENCGVYFAAQSVGGAAIGNTLYENISGVRWSSDSTYGLAADNTSFDNRERGIAIEHADHALVRGNRMVNNTVSQLLVIQTQYDATANCFQNGNPRQLLADFFFADRYKGLAEYQQHAHQDLDSREGSCGAPPPKIDVHRLHAETMDYTERARKILNPSSGS